MKRDEKAKIEDNLLTEESTSQSDEQLSAVEDSKHEERTEQLGEDDQIAPSTVLGNVLMPMRDMGGYTLFVSWAFLFGWGRSIALIENDWTFLVTRAMLFGAVAVGAFILFATRGDFLRALEGTPWEFVYPLMCALPGITFFVEMSLAASCTLWFIAGLGQAAMFFFWVVRLRILSSKQQLYVTCCGFIGGGVVLAIAPFVFPMLVVCVAILAPFGSFVLLKFARVRFEGYSDRLTIWNGDRKFFSGIRNFSSAIPFKGDKYKVVLKGLFSCLYSVFLGFVTCLMMTQSMIPTSEVVIGLGNIISAFIMLLLLVASGSVRQQNLLLRLFLPVTCISMCLLSATWPSEWSLLCALLLFSLFGCLEIMNAYSAYVGTSYDAVRWFWEIQASRMGNASGFFLGWLFVGLFGSALTSSPYTFLLTCFILSCIAVVIEALFFGHSVLAGFEEPDAFELDGAEDVELSESDAKGSSVEECYLQVSMEMAEEFKLSPRQTEIFVYLARGRNVQFIREKLVLSTPTVKSHVYSIYQKMDIHSHQELIDMVEERLKQS